MPHLPNDPVVNGFQNGATLLSILTVLYLISARRAGPLLRYEPRRPVPWGPTGTLIASLYLLFAFYSACVGAGSKGTQEASTLIAAIVEELFVVVGYLFVIATISNASWRDIGLPTSAVELARDVVIGAVACLAALAPVHLVQKLSMKLFFPNEELSGHPLVKSVMSGPSNAVVFVLIGVLAVVVAPICEEITFRLLLQGWLEKWEDKWLGSREEASETEMTNDDQDLSGELALNIRHSSFDPSPPSFGIAGLPHGWFPIIISALMFGLAHLGYGPEPVPLFLLGLVLGYVYQRTHRIVPGMVLHAIFNLVTMVVLWRLKLHPN